MSQSSNMSHQIDLPDMRFVYKDWGGPLRATEPDQPTCRLHRWTVIAPNIRRAARAAGLNSRPNWYIGPTYPAYCERCGVYRDQEDARRLRWKTLETLGALA